MTISQLSETEVAYIAGLIDGEGTIAMYKTYNKNGDRKLRYRLRFCVVATTSMDIITWMTSKMDDASPNPVGKPKKKEHCQGWRVLLSDKPGEEFLQRALPYLVIKKRQAELFLRYRKIQQYCVTNRRSSRNNILALRWVRDWFYEQFRMLNAKGPESVTTSTPNTFATESAIVKIESELNGNVERVLRSETPPSAYLH